MPRRADLKYVSRGKATASSECKRTRSQTEGNANKRVATQETVANDNSAMAEKKVNKMQMTKTCKVDGQAVRKINFDSDNEVRHESFNNNATVEPGSSQENRSRSRSKDRNQGHRATNYSKTPKGNDTSIPQRDDPINDGIELCVDTREFGEEESADSEYQEDEMSDCDFQEQPQSSKKQYEMDEDEYEKLLEEPKFKKVFDVLFDKRLKAVEQNKATAPKQDGPEGRSSQEHGSYHDDHDHDERRSIDRQKEDDNIRGSEGASSRAHRSILEVEKFKALIAEPTGNNLTTGTDVSSKLTDDDFFHTLCHVEEGLVNKIEAGQYVDLEKLLPKDKTKRFGDETRLEWVHRDGGTFLVPAQEKDNKINGVRHWEQAFCVYATIYCGANPQRSKEIWQYVAVINTVAAAYSWDNVASYDYTFCHLMEFNPSRSWSNTYNQMWNLCMREPLSKNKNSRNFGYYHNKPATNTNAATAGVSTTSYSTASNGQQNNHNNAVAPKKGGRYCLNFNKGEKCKYGAKCRFIEHCSLCDAASHAAVNCPKLKGN